MKSDKQMLIQLRYALYFTILLLNTFVCSKVRGAGIATSEDWDGGTQPPSARIDPGIGRGLDDIAQEVRKGLFFVGHPGGGHATAFVISRSYRLLATSAHVADHALEGGRVMLAVPDNGATTYRIEHIWYHPGIVRKLDDGLYVRSSDQSDGEVSYRTPDVAVIQLSGDGPALPGECKLADDRELHDLKPQSIALLGYPGDPENRWPTRDHPIPARLEIGSLVRSTGFSENPEAPPEKRQWIWYQIRSAEGESGGPLFLSNGHIIAIHSLMDKYNEVHEGKIGYRIDCVRELLAYHKVKSGLPFLGRPILAESNWGPDPRLPVLRRAVRLVREARRLRREGSYLVASQRCNEAIELAPYAGAYLERSKVYLYFCGTMWHRLDLGQRRRYANWALGDSRRAIELFPEWIDAYLIDAQNNMYMAYLFNDKDFAINVIDSTNNIIKDDNVSDYQTSFALNCRAQAHRFLGELQSAGQDFDDSIRLAPDEPRWLINRASYLEMTGRPDLAAADKRAADSIRNRKGTLPRSSILSDSMQCTTK